MQESLPQLTQFFPETHYPLFCATANVQTNKTATTLCTVSEWLSTKNPQMHTALFLTLRMKRIGDCMHSKNNLHTCQVAADISEEIWHNDVLKLENVLTFSILLTIFNPPPDETLSKFLPSSTLCPYSSFTSYFSMIPSSFGSFQIYLYVYVYLDVNLNRSLFLLWGTAT